MEYLKNLSLTKQLQYGLLLMAGLCVLGTGSVLIFLSVQQERQHLEIAQYERSRAAAKEIEAYLDDLLRKIDYLARIQGLSDMSPDTHHKLLEGLTRHNSAYETVAIVNKYGNVVNEVSPYGLSFPKHQTGSQAFRKAYHEHEDFLSPMEFDPSSQLPLLTMAVPIRNQQDTIDGVLLARVNLEFLWFVVSKTKVGNTGYAYIVDNRHFLVAQKGKMPESGIPKDLSGVPFIRKLNDLEAPPITTYSGLKGSRVLGAGARIESVNWYVVVELPLAEAYAPGRRMLLVMGGALCLAVVIAIGLGFFFSGQFVQPLRTLTAASEHIQTGDFTVRVQVRERHELGTLATAFNTMTERLEELIAGLKRNVTELEHTSTALVESEERYRLIAENANVLICEMSTTGTFLYANPAYLPILGYAPEELLEIGPGSLSHPDEIGAAGKKFSAMLQERKPTLDVWRFRHKNGEWKWFSCIGNLYVNARGETRVVVIAADITKLKNVEKERENLIDELEKKNAELERFTYTVSHDLKSPLITISGFLGVLEEDLLSGDIEQLKSSIHYISNAAHKMHHLLEDLLQLSRIGRIVGPSANIALVEVMHEALALIAGRISQSGVRVDIAPDLPVVYGDPIRIREVFENLIDNAVKFMGDQAEPRIEIGMRAEQGEHIVFVKDNGIGIDPAYQDRVFGLFEQLNPNGEGTGIGLATVKRIVELHGGRIWLESGGPEQGTTFCVTFGKSSSLQAKEITQP